MAGILKVLTIAALSGILIAVVGIVYRYNTFKPSRLSIPPSPQALRYFQESHERCRSGFLSAVAKAATVRGDIESKTIGDPGAVGTAPPIDHCHIPARDAPKRLLILSSAIHGVEGYVGSAVQQLFLAELLGVPDEGTTGVLLIHGINAHGFIHNRRVSEGNVDLNRNCMPAGGSYAIENGGYSDLDSLLNPRGEVRARSLRNLFFPLRAMGKIAVHGMPALRQAILQGQYRFERGIFYGGKGLEGAIAAVAPLIRETAAPYESVLHIDIHSGYGRRGTLHLFAGPPGSGTRARQLEHIFEGTPIDWGGGGDFYTVTGDFGSYVGSLLPEKHFLSMVFEFGTLDSHTTFGAIHSLHNLVLENQGAHFGYASPEDAAEVGRRFLEGYFPSSPAWRAKAIRDAREILGRAIRAYQTLPLPAG